MHSGSVPPQRPARTLVIGISGSLQCRHPVQPIGGGCAAMDSGMYTSMKA